MANDDLKKKLNSEFKKSMKKNKGNKKAQAFTLIIFLLIGAFTYAFGDKFDLSSIADAIGTTSSSSESSKDSGKSNNKTQSTGQTTGNIEIHYLDVGQGDAIYIKVNDMDILLDAGPKSNSEQLLSQLKALNIDDFEMVIATHAHEDHIGGMPTVFSNYDVESFYMPNGTSTTKIYQNTIKAVQNEGLKVQRIKGGMELQLGTGAKFDVYTPNEESYDNVNNYSPIMKLTYGNNTFMFTGDAEVPIEEEALAKYKNELKSDVLKMGHHGSTTSTSDAFLQAVNPEIAVISLGAGNSYGHPHKEIVDKLNKANITTYRTDLNGQVTVTSDGNNVKVTTQK